MIMRLAEPIHPAERSAFLQDVASQLRGLEIGDGVVARIAAATQRHYLRAPDTSNTRTGVGKYR
jgi:hypothetical protein